MASSDLSKHLNAIQTVPGHITPCPTLLGPPGQGDNFRLPGVLKRRDVRPLLQ